MADKIILIKNLSRPGKPKNWGYFLILLLLLPLLNLYPPAAGAVDLQPLGISAAAKARGGAGLADFASLGGWLLNPATAQQTSFSQIMTSYASLNEDAGCTVFSLIYPTSFANFSLGYLQATSGGFIHTQPAPDGGITVLEEFSYLNRWLVFGAASQIQRDVTIGGQVKYVREGFSGSFSQGSGFLLDAGGLWRPAVETQLAVVFQNVLLRKISWSGGAVEVLPTHLKLGFAWQPEKLKQLLFLGEADYTLGWPAIYRAGVEWSLASEFRLRAGLAQQAVRPGQSKIGYTLGLGLKLGNFTLDYAYCPDFFVDEMSSHYFSLAYIFAPEAR